MLSADNTFVLAGGKDNKISMWDLGSILPKIEKTFEGQYRSG